MYLLYFFLIVFFLSWILGIMLKDERDSWIKPFLLVGLTYAIIGGIPIGAIFSFDYYYGKEKMYTYEKEIIPLISMKNEKEINGRIDDGMIFGVNGYINSIEYLYLFGKVNNNGGIYRIKIPMSKVMIYEDGKNKMVTINKKVNGSNKFKNFHFGSDVLYRYEIHVPKNSIKKKFVIN